MPDVTAPGATNAPAPSNEHDPAKAERKRAAEIRTRCRALSLGDDFTDALIEEGVSVETAATRIVDELAKRTKPAPKGPGLEVGASGDDPLEIRAAMAEAIAVRYMPGHKPEGERFRTYTSWRPSDMAAELLRLRGQAVDRHNRIDIAERSFHTTSDFPLLLATATNRMLRTGYAQAEPTFRTFMGRKTFNDFTPHTFLNIGDFPTLLQYREGAEIKVGTISESSEKIQLNSYGRRVRVTRQMLVNDQLGAFADFGTMIGRRVSEFENTAAYAVVMANAGDGPNLADGGVVFQVGDPRKNKAGTASAITVASVGEGRAAIRKQKNQDGSLVNIAPRIMLTGADTELAAEQLLSAVQPQQAGNVNPFSGKLQLVSDANVTGTHWFLFADPNAVPVYVYGYLDGAEGPQTSVSNPHEHDGTDIKVILDFAVGAIDFRGGWHNAGA